VDTERPDHDDTGASGEAAEEARAEQGTAGAEGTSEPGTSGPVEGPAEEVAAEDEGASQDVSAGTSAPEAAASDAPASDTPASAPDAPADQPSDGGARRHSPALIASVAAAVLLVGGGGAYLAAGASGDSGGRTTSGASGDETPPPLHLDGFSEGGGNGIAPGEPNPYGAVYKAEGPLPDGPDEAPVYRASGEVTQDEVARLAEALGVEGTPVAQGQTWTVGARDAAGPRLQVTRQAPGTWTYHRYAPGSDDCQGVTVCTKDPANPAGDPVSEEAAVKAAAPVLKAAGQDDAKIDARQVMGAQRVVNADPVVGGLPTYGWTTGITVSAQGEVVGGSGQVKAPVKGDTYPVLDAEKTLGLMNAAPGSGHRMGIGGCAGPVPLKDRLEAPCEQPTGSSKKDTLAVERAVFGLASHSVDGEQALVPSWLFEVRVRGAQDAVTVTYPAVDPTYLASSAPSREPPGRPSPRPTGPKDSPSSAPVTRNVPVDGYTADGRELTVAFTGGVCTDYKVTASESRDEVTVTVTGTTQPGEICIMIAKVFHKTVQLDEPLGDREVVGSDGKAIQKEKASEPSEASERVPETSGAR
jgi:hypothetical protein